MTRRTLIVLRHGKSDWSVPVEDRHRPLKERGRRQAAEAGRWLAAHAPQLDLAVVSPATRAADAWHLAAAELPGLVPERTDEQAYTVVGADLLAIVRGLDSAPDARGAHTVVLVGHSPACDELVAHLTGEQVTMKTSGLAVVGMQEWNGAGELLAAGRPPAWAAATPEHDDGTRLVQLRSAHESAGMVGWDFSRLDGRMTSEDPDWDFEADCLAAMRGAQRILDLGTGGGERLLRLIGRLGAEAAGKDVSATEGWEPNLPVATAALAGADVDVRAYDAESGDRLPWPDATFDLVMSRHEAVDMAEIARVLAPGGRVLTQQVHGHEVPELREWLGGQVQYPEVTAEHDVSAMEAAGLEVDTVGDWSGAMTFADAEALVVYLGLVPWDVPEDFTVDDHAETLFRLDAERPITVTQRRYRVYGRRPETTA